MIGKIKKCFGHPLSGLRSLVIQSEKGELRLIQGDQRCINSIIEDLGFGAKVEVIEKSGNKFIKPID